MLLDMWSQLHNIKEGKRIWNNNIKIYNYSILFLYKTYEEYM